MSERSRSPPPSKATEEQSPAADKSVHAKMDHPTNLFQTMMEQFGEMKGTQNHMKNGLEGLGVKISEMETNSNAKFESIEKKLHDHDMAINEMRNLKNNTSGGGGVKRAWKHETDEGGDVNMRGASAAGSSKDGGVSASEGSGSSAKGSKSWGGG